MSKNWSGDAIICYSQNFLYHICVSLLKRIITIRETTQRKHIKVWAITNIKIYNHINARHCRYQMQWVRLCDCLNTSYNQQEKLIEAICKYDFPCTVIFLWSFVNHLLQCNSFDPLNFYNITTNFTLYHVIHIWVLWCNSSCIQAQYNIFLIYISFHIIIFWVILTMSINQRWHLFMITMSNSTFLWNTSC